MRKRHSKRAVATNKRRSKCNSNKKRSNPFNPPLLSDKDKLNEAFAVLQKIAENVAANKARTATSARHRNPYSPVWDETVLDSPTEERQFGYDGNFLTPLNFVASVVEPKTSNKLLKLLLEGDQPGEVGDFYHDVVSDLEQATNTQWEQGTPLPEAWFKERKVSEWDDPLPPFVDAILNKKYKERAKGRNSARLRDELGSLLANKRLKRRD